jgi:hypothetical protein
MNALIDPTVPVAYIESWTTAPPYTPTYAQYANSARVCQVTAVTFDVASPLFWTPCAGDVVADRFYYDTTTAAIAPIVNAPSTIPPEDPATP